MSVSRHVCNSTPKYVSPAPFPGDVCPLQSAGEKCGARSRCGTLPRNKRHHRLSPCNPKHSRQYAELETQIIGISMQYLPNMHRGHCRVIQNVFLLFLSLNKATLQLQRHSQNSYLLTSNLFCKEVNDDTNPWNCLENKRTTQYNTSPFFFVTYKLCLK